MLQRYVLFNVWSISVTSVFLSLRCILLYHSLKSVNTYSVTCRSFMVVWLFSHSENVNFSDTWIHPMAEAKGLKIYNIWFHWWKHICASGKDFVSKVYVGYFIYFLRKICMKKCWRKFFGPISFGHPYNSNSTKTHLDLALTYSSACFPLLIFQTLLCIC